MADEHEGVIFDYWIPNGEPSPAERIAWLFRELSVASSPEEHRSACATLIREAHHLDASQRLALAEAVEVGFCSLGRPKEGRRGLEIRRMLMNGPSLGGVLGCSRNEAIKKIADRFGMTHETARKAHDAAWSTLGKEGGALSSREEKPRFISLLNRKRPR